MNLLSLYPVILVPVLFEWITDEDTCYVDTACCNRKLRTAFLSILAKGSISHCIKQRCDREQIEWMKLRGISLKRFSFIKWDSDTASMFDLLPTSKELTCLEAPVGEELASLVKEKGLSVSSVKLRTGSVEIAETILRGLRNVTHLDLSQYIGVSREVYAHLASLCPDLKSFVSPQGNSGMLIKTESAILNMSLQDLMRSMGSVDSGLFSRYSHLCSLQACPVSSSTTVNIDGKWYRLTSLMLNETPSTSEVAFLLPLLESIESFTYTRTGVFTPQTFNPFHFVAAASNLIYFYCQGITLNHSLHLTTCRVLKHLLLTNCVGVKDTTLLLIADHCPALETLEFTKCDLTDTCLVRVFEKCPQLSKLNVQGSAKLYALMCHLIPSVQSLSLTSVNMGMLKIHTEGRLRQLSGSSWDAMTDEQFLHLLSLNRNLLRIRLIHNETVTDDVVESMVALCPLLTSVKISLCNVTPWCIVLLAECRHLRELSLMHVRIADQLMEQFLMKQSNLERLTLIRTCTEGTVSLIARYCPALKHLNVSECVEVTTNEVIEVLDNCSSLSYLNLDLCSQVGSGILVYLKDKRMRYVSVFKTDISKEEMVSFVSETGFSCSSKLVY